MNIDLIMIGKTDSRPVEELIDLYRKRINFYVRFGVVTLPDPKNRKTLSDAEQKKAEGDILLRQFAPGDCVVLLDERGTELRSVEFAAWLQKRMNGSTRRLCFVIGGPYGFSDAVYARADGKLSLSRMTFSHQLVRVLFTEQLYRGFTILGNEPYHHE